MIKDLTSGKPLKLILEFSIPVLFGYLFQQFYNVVDTVIVGKYLGVAALAGVGSTGSVNFLIIGFVAGLCSGLAIPIAQKFGARDYTEMRKFVAGSELISLVLAIVITLVTVLFCKPLLALMQTPADIIDQADAYIRIIFVGIPAIFLFNIISCILRAVGDSRTPVLFLVVASILNIFLDLLFILVFQWGVAGAAWATVISQGLSGIAAFVYMRHSFSILKLSKDDFKLSPRHIGRLCEMGIPMGLQYSITAIGSVLIQVSVNTLGASLVAAVAAAQKISLFFVCPFDALGTTMATFGGQNTGAGKFDRLSEGLRWSSLLGFIYAGIAFAVMFFFGKDLGTLFLDVSETKILADVRTFLVSNSAFYFPLALVNIFRFMIQGMGFSPFAIFSGVFEMIARSAVALFVVPLFGYVAVCFASPTAWILADLFLVPAFFYCKRKLQRGLKGVSKPKDSELLDLECS